MNKHTNQPITAAIRVKPEFAHVVIGFNNCSLPLGKRPDILKLYEFAKNKPYEPWLKMFEVVPTDKELEAAKVESFKQRQQQRNRGRKNSTSKPSRGSNKAEQPTTE